MQKRKFKKNNGKKEQYAFPVPERESILGLLEEQGKPLTFKKLIKLFALTHDEELQGFEYRLKAMLRDGQLLLDRRARYCLASKLDLIKGIIIAHPDGFGFVKPEPGGEDLFLSPRQMRRVFHGDKVFVQELATTTRRGRREAQITDVIERNTETIIGRLRIERGCAFVQPLQKEMTHDLYVPQDYLHEAKDGNLVNVRILIQPDLHLQPIVEVIKILEEDGNNSALNEIALNIHTIPHEWPDTLESSLSILGEEVTEADKANRCDLRDKPFVTIDGEDARDFDDAVYCQTVPEGGWRLYVAIADVSHYVAIDSPLDEEASLRGNSVYLPTEVVPMLPEQLSNGLCSLNPNVDRLALVCEMKVNAEGELTRYRFYDAVICSHARLTYTQVDRFLKEESHSIDPALHADLLNLYQLYQTLLVARKARGAIELDTIEPQFELDDLGAIKSIKARRRNDAHRLIEECMLIANVAAARLIKKSQLPALYRNHDKPASERIETFRAFLGGIGLQLQGDHKPHIKDYSVLLEQVRTRPDFETIQLLMLRSLNQAVYSSKNLGHFGLGYSAYTHYTSPIRRYPDLIVHRAIKHFISQKEIEDYPYSADQLETIGSYCSTTERRADEASRFVIDTLKCQFMHDKLGQVFKGKIISVTHFGVFIRLDDYFIEGLLHITQLKRDYYHFDPIKQQLIGERSGQVYRLLESIEVRVVRVSESDRQIDFNLAVDDNEI